MSIILVKERVWSPLGARPQRRFGHTRKTRNGTRLGGARGPEEMQHHTKRCPAKATRPNTAGVATSAKASPGTGTWKGAPHLRSEPACPLRKSSSEGCSRTRRSSCMKKCNDAYYRPADETQELAQLRLCASCAVSRWYVGGHGEDKGI